MKLANQGKLCAIFSGCLIVLLISVQVHSKETPEGHGDFYDRYCFQFHSCRVNFYNYDEVNVGWVFGQDTYAASAAYFSEALLASNSYSDNVRFEGLDWIPILKVQRDSGLYAQIYTRSSEEVAVVFRGTEFESSDDRRANIVSRCDDPNGQYGQAAKLVRELAMGNVKDSGGKAIEGRITRLVGHSLGGALAAHAYQKNQHLKRLEHSKVVILNPSPRCHEHSSKFIVFREKGEFLDFVPGSYSPTHNFSTVDPVGQHSSYNLARHLLAIAAAGGANPNKEAQAEAMRLLAENVGCTEDNTSLGYVGTRRDYQRELNSCKCGDAHEIPVYRLAYYRLAGKKYKYCP